MNPPQVYMCSPPWTLLPPPSPYHPSGSSQCSSPRHPVSCIEPGLATRFIHDILHVSMPFSQIFPPSPSPTESIRLFYTSVSLLLSRTQGYCYHLPKFHIYALVYCIGVFLSGLLHSVYPLYQPSGQTPIIDRRWHNASLLRFAGLWISEDTHTQTLLKTHKLRFSVHWVITYQGSANFFYKGSYSKYLRLWETCSLFFFK